MLCSPSSAVAWSSRATSRVRNWQGSRPCLAWPLHQTGARPQCPGTAGGERERPGHTDSLPLLTIYIQHFFISLFLPFYSRSTDTHVQKELKRPSSSGPTQYVLLLTSLLPSSYAKREVSPGSVKSTCCLQHLAAKKAVDPYSRSSKSHCESLVYPKSGT